MMLAPRREAGHPLGRSFLIMTTNRYVQISLSYGDPIQVLWLLIGAWARELFLLNILEPQQAVQVNQISDFLL